MDSAVLNVVFACFEGGYGGFGYGKCGYIVLILCRMNVKTVEGFMEVEKSWLENGEIMIVKW